MNPQHIAQVIEILHYNGIQVSNSKDAYERLKQFEADPNFAILLGHIFNAPTCPVGDSVATQGSVPWLQYRRLAGITLKNNVERAKTLLGEPAVTAAAQSCVVELRDPKSASLVSIAAQIAVMITSIVGLEWWARSVCDFPTFILQDLLGASNPIAVLGGLYCLEFLLEDVPKQLGGASEVIVKRVAAMVVDGSKEEGLRKAAFKVASHPYELGSALEWNVEELSPMQQGLCNASHAFAGCCTELLAVPQLPFASIVLRSATLMFDYLDYFYNGNNPSEGNHLVATWVGAALHHLQHPATIDVASSAADFIAYAFEVYERTGGEGPICAVTASLVQHFNAMIPVLFRYIVLSQEETTTILETDHYTHRDAYAVVMNVASSSRGAVLEDDGAGGDDEDGGGTLRKSSSSCLDKLCVVAPSEASALVLAEIGSTWNHSDWRVKEASLLGFGSAVRGCFASMAGHLSNIVPFIRAYIDDPNEHVCVVSMSIWCVQRLASWLVTDGRSHAGDFFSSIARRLESDSKRVQASVVTALKVLLQSAIEAGFELPAAFLEDTVRRIHRCLPDRYNTGNLAALCDVSLLILGMLPDNLLSPFAAPFFGSRSAKMAEFSASYNASIVEQHPNALINKDVMFLDRVIVGILNRSPSLEQHQSILSTWADVLWDVARRGAYDDADLIFNAIFAASQFVRSLETSALCAWLASREYDLVKSTLQILEHAPPNGFVRSSCFAMIFQIVNVSRELAIADPWVLETIYRCASKLLEEAVDDDVFLFSSISNILGLLIKLKPDDQSLQAVLLLSRKLRADVFSDSLMHHLAVAFILCNVLQTHPSLLAQLPLGTMCALMAASPNSLSKSEATIALCTAVASRSSEELAAALSQQQHLQQLMRMVYSWQQAAVDCRNGTLEAIAHALQSIRACPPLGQQLHGILATLPEAFRAQLCATYGLQQ